MKHDLFASMKIPPLLDQLNLVLLTLNNKKV